MLTHLPLVLHIYDGELGQQWFREIRIEIQKFLIHEYTFENVVCEEVAILSSGRWVTTCLSPLIAKFMGPTWGPSGADRIQVGPCWPQELCYLGRFCQWLGMVSAIGKTTHMSRFLVLSLVDTFLIWIYKSEVGCFFLLWQLPWYTLIGTWTNPQILQT